MDFLTIYITSKVTHAKTTVPRSLTASVLGAVYGVVSVVWINDILLSMLLTGVVSAVITLIAFGYSGSMAGLAKQSVILWGCGALLSGIMSTLMAIGEPVYLDEGNGAPTYSKYYILTFAAAVILIQLFSGKSQRKCAEVVVHINGTVFRFTALSDSGNLAKDPVSGCPVIIAAADLFNEELRGRFERIRRGDPDDSYSHERGEIKVRVIPHRTLNGEGILYGFLPDDITVNGKKKNAVVVIDEAGKKKGYGGFDGIVPMYLCE